MASLLLYGLLCCPAAGWSRELALLQVDVKTSAHRRLPGLVPSDDRLQELLSSGGVVTVALRKREGKRTVGI